MYKLLFILLSSCAVFGCSMTPTSTIVVESYHTVEPSEKLFNLVGVDGKPYKGKPIKAGSHIFYIEGFEVSKNDKKEVTHSLHAMRVRLLDNTSYQIDTRSEEGVLYVWLIDKASGKRVSSVSSLSQSNLASFERDPNMELITITAEPISALDQNGKSSCQFRTTVSNQNQGFADSITDKKLPDRFNGPNC